jgi:hypothetical protein
MGTDRTSALFVCTRGTRLDVHNIAHTFATGWRSRTGPRLSLRSTHPSLGMSNASTS